MYIAEVVIIENQETDYIYIENPEDIDTSKYYVIEVWYEE